METLRCRPKDLALVIGGFPASNRDRIVRVTTINVPVSALLRTSMWDYEGELEGPLGTRATCVADSCLRPIRDPGNDAVDEMVAKVGRAPMTLAELMEREVTQ